MDKDVLKTLADAFLTISSCFNKLLASDPASQSSSPSASDSIPTPAAPLSKAPKGEEAEKVLSFEEVRSILVKKSQEGYTQLVKECISSFGAVKLSDVKKEDYKALLELVESKTGGESNA